MTNIKSIPQNTVAPQTVNMPEQTPRHIQQFHSDWKQLTADTNSNVAASDTLQKLRIEAWKEFKRIGFPIARKGNELWKYTDLRAIDQQQFTFGQTPQNIDLTTIATKAPISDGWLNIIFIDGAFASNLSDDLSAENGAEISNLAYLNNHTTSPSATENIGALADHLQNGFVSLNTAFISDAIAIQIEPETNTDRPINLIFVTTENRTDTPRAVYPRASIHIANQSSATIIETHLSISDSSTHLSVPVVEIKLEQDAELTHYRLQLENENSFHFGTTRVHQADGAIYNSTSFATGAAIGRNDVHTILAGENAESTLHGIYITNNKQHQDNEISTTHAKPHGTSHQYYKGILAGQSQAVFSGKITVQRGAQKTDADQKDLNLLLSHGAEVDTKPSLEIYADDVKCAHGATAGHVDENTLFYLQSRGIDYQTAQALLIRGFANEILDEFNQPHLRQFLDQLLDNLMPQLQAASDTIGTT